MRRQPLLSIDFAPRTWARNRTARWLMVMSVLTWVLGWGLAQHIGERRMVLQQSLDEAGAGGTQARAAQRQAGQALTTEAARSINEAIGKLNLPWEFIFAALDVAAMPNVVLLGLEPDMAASTVRLGGQAASLDRVLEYRRRLEAADGIASAVLVRHEMHRGEVRFGIEVRWRPAT